MMRPIVSALLIATIAIVCGKAASAQTPADIVLLSGKVITVDDRFTIAEALAIKGERILAVGSNAEVEKHKGPLTRVVDLNRRTVIPGLIDNHAHYMRAAEYWHREVRLDGITSHSESLELIKHKAAESKPGEWVVVLGGLVGRAVRGRTARLQQGRARWYRAQQSGGAPTVLLPRLRQYPGTQGDGDRADHARSHWHQDREGRQGRADRHAQRRPRDRSLAEQARGGGAGQGGRERAAADARSQ